jgi:hypothetical protein
MFGGGCYLATFTATPSGMNIPGIGSPITNWQGPEFKTTLDNTRRVFKGNYFSVYERAGVAGGSAALPDKGASRVH